MSAPPKSAAAIRARRPSEINQVANAGIDTASATQLRQSLRKFCQRHRLNSLRPDSPRTAGKNVLEPRDAADAERMIGEGTAEVIYQPVFNDPAGWTGRADFLELQPDGGYEVVDTKLARHAKPYYILQLCFYTEQV